MTRIAIVGGHGKIARRRTVDRAQIPRADVAAVIAGRRAEGDAG